MIYHNKTKVFLEGVVDEEAPDWDWKILQSLESHPTYLFLGGGVGRHF